MDVDQLRMILDTVKDLGEAGKSAFLWWLILEKSPAILCSILIPASFGFIARAIYNYHRACDAYRAFAQEVFSACKIQYLDVEDIQYAGQRAAAVTQIKEKLNV